MVVESERVFIHYWINSKLHLALHRGLKSKAEGQLPPM